MLFSMTSFYLDAHYPIKRTRMLYFFHVQTIDLLPAKHSRSQKHPNMFDMTR